MHYIIDAKNRPLGRIASEVAVILQGKKNPDYEPRLSGSDTVTVKNVEHIALTGKKKEQKVYYRHTGPLGHLKERKYKDVAAKNPKWALTNAIRLMLPKNKLAKARLKRLTIV